MNKKIGMYGSIINLCAVVGFAFCMLIGAKYGSFITSIFIAFGYVSMMCAFAAYCKLEKKALGYAAMMFAGIYATIILLVYYAQVTSVHLENLNDQALRIIDYSKFGLYFNYDLLGYCLMAISTFFAGFTIEPETKADKWLKRLLIIHGVFAISCFIMPMLGVFNANNAGTNSMEWIGTAVMEFWSIYFALIGILSFMHFKNKKIAN